jgi:hypothetical protein
VFRPLDKAGHVPGALNILADAKGFGVSLEERVFLGLAGALFGQTRCGCSAAILENVAVEDVVTPGPEHHVLKVNGSAQVQVLTIRLTLALI